MVCGKVSVHGATDTMDLTLPQGLVRPLQGARAAARIVTAGGISGALLAAYLLEGRFHGVPEARRDAYIHYWSGSILRLLGVQMRIQMHGLGGQADQTGAFVPDILRRDLLTAGPRLLVCNHRSAIDIALTLHIFGGQLLARGDMAAWPGIGKLATAAGTLYVDREDTSSGAAAIRRLSKRLGEGRTVIVFPEGTTYPGDEVRPFHAGAFMAIARAHGQVLPAGIAYAGDDAFFGDEPFSTHVRRVAGVRGTRVVVAVGEPIPFSGQKAGELRDRSHAAVQALVHWARGLLEGPGRSRNTPEISLK